MTKNLIVGLLLATFSSLVWAQDAGDTEKDRQYVTDQLRLSLYEEPSSQSKVLKLLQSGDVLLIDEIRGPYALVTDVSGAHGWVKRGFLVANPTANILLREEREKNASLFEEIEKLSSSKVVIDTYEKDMDGLVEKMEKLRDEKSEAEATIEALRQEMLEMQSSLELRKLNRLPLLELLEDTLKTYWQIIAAVFVSLLLLCFLVTKSIVESRIKRKFHGIKIW